jgi:hypothetical protein
MASQLPKTIHLAFRTVEFNLSTAILYTLAYSDIFDFPMTINEIHRYLIGFKAEKHEIEEEIRKLRIQGNIIEHQEFYALPGRENIFDLRRRRVPYSAKLWRDSLRYGRWISRLPFVRMVAATGALVSNNVVAGADLDYFIVTEPGWLWSARAMILAIDRYTTRTGSRANICPNYIITTENLELIEQDLFTAQEMARMVPISGIKIYEEFRKRNAWTKGFLPNAQGYPRHELNGSGDSKFQTGLELIMRNPASRRIEKWEMDRKIRKFSMMPNTNSETRFSVNLCKGHFDGHKQRTMQVFENRIRSLKLAS